MSINEKMDDHLSTAINRLPDILQNDLDQPLCVCNQVIKIDIIRAISAGVTSIDLLKQQTGATDGNGCCRRQVESLIKHLTTRD